MSTIKFCNVSIWGDSEGGFNFKKGTIQTNKIVKPLINGASAVVYGCKTQAQHTLMLQYVGASYWTFIDTIETLYLENREGVLDLSSYGIGSFSNCLIESVDFEQFTPAKKDTCLTVAGVSYIVKATIIFTQLGG